MEILTYKMDKSTDFSDAPDFDEECFELCHRTDATLGDIEDTEHALSVNGVWHMQYLNDVNAFGYRRDYYGFYLIHGCVHVTEPIEAVLHAGDLIVYSPETWYRYKNEGKFAYYSFHFTGHSAAEFLSTAGFEVNRVYSPGVNRQALIAMHAIYDLFRFRTPLWEAESAMRLTEFLVTLGKSLLPNIGKDQRIRATAAYILRNLSRPISITALAEMAFMSVSGYSAKFKRLYGMAPADYITAQRIQLASQLLAETDMLISTVAAECGFTDPYYFSRIFRRKMGASPRAFREEKHRVEKKRPSGA